MELLFGGAIHKTKSNSATTESGLIGATNVQLMKMESKKRGVYVEKWGISKPIRIEDNNRQPRMKTKSKSRPMSQKLLTTAPAESKIATLTRLLGTADPAVRYKKRKSLKTTPTTPKISKQNSKMSNITAKPQPKPEVKPLRNIIEENKKNAKNTKFRSHVLREVYSNMSEKTTSYKSRKDIVQTPSNCSKVTSDISDHAHWSKIFPRDRQNTVGKNLLQQYICNHEQGGNTLNDNKDKKYNTQGDGKQEPMYDFFIDLLESVCDEELPNTDGATKFETSPKTSDVKFEIDDNVVQKLYMLQQDSNRYTITDDINEPSSQNRQLADYYNNRKRLVPQKRRRKRKTFNKNFPSFPSYPKEEPKKLKKPNLLNILKQQLSMDYTEEEPSNMYEALFTIAKQNRKKRQQIYIDTSAREPSEPDGVCRFKRRNVISPSTRQAKRDPSTKGYSINATRDKYKSDMTDKDSSHSIEVIGFDYDEEINLNLDAEYSDSDAAAKSGRQIMSLNEGITTVTQYWNR